MNILTNRLDGKLVYVKFDVDEYGHIANESFANVFEQGAWIVVYPVVDKIHVTQSRRHTKPGVGNLLALLRAQDRWQQKDAWYHANAWYHVNGTHGIIKETYAGMHSILDDLAAAWVELAARACLARIATARRDSHAPWISAWMQPGWELAQTRRQNYANLLAEIKK